VNDGAIYPADVMPNKSSIADDASVIPMDRRITYQCLLISTRISQLIAPMLEEKYGLSVPTWRVMAVIGRYGPLSAKEVAGYTSTDAFFVSRGISHLRKHQLITKHADPADRRRVVLQLTKKGESIRDDVERVISRVETAILGALGEAEREALKTNLSDLAYKALGMVEPPVTWRDFTD